jgi:hypothetical protein
MRSSHCSNRCEQSSSINTLLIPVLYSSLEFKSVARCNERLEFLLRRPDLAHYVHKLVLRPSHLQDPSPELFNAEIAISKAIELLAPNLYSLHTFIWDGLEMPEDYIWSTLRRW